MFEIWIATWLAFNYSNSPSFVIAPSSAQIIAHVQSIYSQDSGYRRQIENGKVCIHQITFDVDRKGRKNNMRIKTKNISLVREITKVRVE